MPASLSPCAVCEEPSYTCICTSGHTLCLSCCYSSLGIAGAALSLQSGAPPASHYYPTQVSADIRGTPGLLCPICLPSPSAVALYSTHFWEAVQRGSGAAPPCIAGAACTDTAYLPGWWLPGSYTPLLTPPTPVVPSHAHFFQACAAMLAVNRPEWVGQSDLALTPHPGASPPPPSRPHTLVQCPTPACAALLSLDTASAPFHVTCSQCTRGLCGACGQAWTLPGSPVSHALRSCLEQAHASDSLRQVTLAPLASVAGEGGKRCPRCDALITRPRDHACHQVTCLNALCATPFCFCCLLTEEEQRAGGGEAHRGCPQYCSDACPCEPCHECSQGRRCSTCPGSGCIPCSLGNRAETAGERESRLARHAVALAAVRQAHPQWVGPRKEVGGAAAGGGGAPRPPRLLSPWVTHTLLLPPAPPSLLAAARDLREGLQLLDSVGRALPGGTPTAPPPGAWLRAVECSEEQVHHPGLACALQEALLLLQHAATHPLPPPGCWQLPQLTAAVALSARTAAEGRVGQPSELLGPSNLHYGGRLSRSAVWAESSLKSPLLLLREAAAACQLGAAAGQPSPYATQCALTLLQLLQGLLEPVRPSDKEYSTATEVRMVRRMGWLVEMLSFEGLQALCCALALGEGEVCAAAAECTRLLCSCAEDVAALREAWEEGEFEPSPAFPEQALLAVGAVLQASERSPAAAASLACLWLATLCPVAALAALREPREWVAQHLGAVASGLLLQHAGQHAGALAVAALSTLVTRVQGGAEQATLLALVPVQATSVRVSSYATAPAWAASSHWLAAAALHSLAQGAPPAMLAWARSTGSSLPRLFSALPAAFLAASADPSTGGAYSAGAFRGQHPLLKLAARVSRAEWATVNPCPLLALLLEAALFEQQGRSGSNAQIAARERRFWELAPGRVAQLPPPQLAGAAGTDLLAVLLTLRCSDGSQGQLQALQGLLHKGVEAWQPTSAGYLPCRLLLLASAHERTLPLLACLLQAPSSAQALAGKAGTALLCDYLRRVSAFSGSRGPSVEVALALAAAGVQLWPALPAEAHVPITPASHPFLGLLSASCAAQEGPVGALLSALPQHYFGPAAAADFAALASAAAERDCWGLFERLLQAAAVRSSPWLLLEALAAAASSSARPSAGKQAAFDSLLALLPGAQLGSEVLCRRLFALVKQDTLLGWQHLALVADALPPALLTGPLGTELLCAACARAPAPVCSASLSLLLQRGVAAWPPAATPLAALLARAWKAGEGAVGRQAGLEALLGAPGAREALGGAAGAAALCAALASPELPEGPPEQLLQLLLAAGASPWPAALPAPATPPLPGRGIPLLAALSSPRPSRLATAALLLHSIPEGWLAAQAEVGCAALCEAVRVGAGEEQAKLALFHSLLQLGAPAWPGAAAALPPGALHPIQAVAAGGEQWEPTLLALLAAAGAEELRQLQGEAGAAALGSTASRLSLPATQALLQAGASPWGPAAALPTPTPDGLPSVFHCALLDCLGTAQGLVYWPLGEAGSSSSPSRLQVLALLLGSPGAQAGVRQPSATLALGAALKMGSEQEGAAAWAALAGAGACPWLTPSAALPCLPSPCLAWCPLLLALHLGRHRDSSAGLQLLSGMLSHPSARAGLGMPVVSPGGPTLGALALAGCSGERRQALLQAGAEEGGEYELTLVFAGELGKNVLQVRCGLGTTVEELHDLARQANSQSMGVPRETVGRRLAVWGGRRMQPGKTVADYPMALLRVTPLMKEAGPAGQ